jgi:hypothetical protein
MVLAVLATVWWRQENSPERLLAEAYTQSRQFDLRLPGAGFAPITPGKQVRGGISDNEPVPLLTARAAIERKLQQSATDAHWLQLEARAEILEGRYDEAIDTLDRLLAAGPVTASLLMDDGMAYYLRGTATGSENDRATSLDDLRRADELAPGDPVILFNEAILMEDRGQVMNAVETWNRFLKFERDPKWLDEGRKRLGSLEEKLEKLRTHQSRMEKHLATPQSMRALAGDLATLTAVDEEFSTTLLPRLLDAAFAHPVDRSRGSPCAERCAAARLLLDALAASLLRNHQDSWLKDFLPSDPSRLSNTFPDAVHALGQAINADERNDYAGAEHWAQQSEQLFSTLRNAAGQDRAAIERVYAEQRSFTFVRCERDAQSLLTQHNQYTWIHAQATSLAAGCDMNAGAASMNNELFRHAFELAQASHYAQLELRARNGMASWAYQSGDNEDAWRLLLESVHRFYAGDFPPFRAATFMGSLVLVERNTPRVELTLLLSREQAALFSLAKSPVMLAQARAQLIRAALRSGALQEAREQMRLSQDEIAALPNGTLPGGYHAEDELGLADVYLARGDLSAAAQQLDAARDHLTGEDNWLPRTYYAGERGELELALGHPEQAESTLRDAILGEELRARGTGPSYIVSARQDRGLYAMLAGVWFAEHRPGIEILALWERYRLRILGKPVPACADRRLDCLAPDLTKALHSTLQDSSRALVGQIVLHDRTLLYRADAEHVAWSQTPVPEADALAAVTALEHVVTSPASSQASVDQAAGRVGDFLLSGGKMIPDDARTVLIEADPILGNLAWAAVETAGQPIGLRLDLEELPSLLLHPAERAPTDNGTSLIVGASIAAGGNPLLPDALQEARLVAGNDRNFRLLIGADATEPHVAAHLSTAPLIHFAGHTQQFGSETHLLLAPSGAAGDTPYLDDKLFRRDPPRAARLVVFSACSTGKREEGWNHGMGDIVDTLASLGVPEVVATRWQIDSASAVPMMDVFYRGLSSGQSVPQALTAARQSLIRDARYRHPYYWAAYYASGVGTTDLREVLHGGP